MTVRTRTPADNRFDDLARGLATGTVSRRRTLALIGSSLFGGALGGISLLDDAEAAKCRKKCQKKDGDAKKRCQKKCKKKAKKVEPKFDCQNLGTACGLGGKTLVCNCRLDKEGNQTCGNVVNPPNGVAFTACNLSTESGPNEFCDFGGNVCRTKCETG